MFTKTSEYALRAMIWIASQPPDAAVSGPRIAAETRIPRKYLAMILGTLVRHGLLVATPGRHGGFRLAVPAGELNLAGVIGPFEPAFSRNQSACPFGNVACNDADPCGAHHRWKRVKLMYQDFLNETSLFDVAKKGHPLLTSNRKPRTRARRSK